MASHTEENYLKAIYKLTHPGKQPVSTNALSEHLSTRAASVTDMIQKLADKKLIHYKKYQGVTLTEAGKKLAVKVIRKHRLWEVFLVDVLEFGWDQVHDIAEELEHINSEELIKRLDKFLGHPRFDPHGDPIPDTDGNFSQKPLQLLSSIPLRKKGQLAGVVDHSTAFFKYLEQLGIKLGEHVTVQEKFEYDRSLRIKVGKAAPIVLSHDVARNILVKIA